jgi:hypothetical protein
MSLLLLCYFVLAVLLPDSCFSVHLEASAEKRLNHGSSGTTQVMTVLPVTTLTDGSYYVIWNNQWQRYLIISEESGNEWIIKGQYLFDDKRDVWLCTYSGGKQILQSVGFSMYFDGDTAEPIPVDSPGTSEQLTISLATSVYDFNEYKSDFNGNATYDMCIQNSDGTYISMYFQTHEPNYPIRTAPVCGPWETYLFYEVFFL